MTKKNEGLFIKWLYYDEHSKDLAALLMVRTRFIEPCPHKNRDYCIGSNFWKFHPMRIDFTLGEPVSLVKMFRLFRLNWIFLVFRVWM